MDPQSQTGRTIDQKSEKELESVFEMREEKRQGWTGKTRETKRKNKREWSLGKGKGRRNIQRKEREGIK